MRVDGSERPITVNSFSPAKGISDGLVPRNRPRRVGLKSSTFVRALLLGQPVKQAASCSREHHSVFVVRDTR